MLISITEAERREAFFAPIKGSTNNQIQHVINKKVFDLERIDIILLWFLGCCLTKEPCGAYYQHKDENNKGEEILILT